ncbi:MAG TPA: hypothetical protein QGG93_08705 [Verrucomicrobiota bacterium]|jgi:hypothetical protein|nr:hypothetical protein [Verrucomicrobiota bacterium]|tara:strand:- start:55 stop:303 length:249 start_codon:yes stop_codon:yes gene_type:complete
MAQMLELAPSTDAVDTVDKIVSLASEITGKPADLDTITGNKTPAKHKAKSFDPAAYQRTKRLAKLPHTRSRPARFDPQLPVS